MAGSAVLAGSVVLPAVLATNDATLAATVVDGVAVFPSPGSSNFAATGVVVFLTSGALACLVSCLGSLRFRYRASFSSRRL